MKKSLLLLALLLVSFKVFSQESILPIDSTTGKITYSEVIKVDSVLATELFVRANIWFVNNFNSAKNVIQLSDKEAGVVIGKGNFPVTCNNPNRSAFNVFIQGTVDFTLEIQTRDGRYKYSITDISFKGLAGNPYDLFSDVYPTTTPFKKQFNMRWLEVKQNMNLSFLTIIERLKLGMTLKENIDNW
jgi:hypothetical protein